MEKFLQKLASEIAQRNPESFRRICIVFPNRRASLYFRHHFARCFDKPVWLPELFSLEDFVMKHSGLTTADPLWMLISLYKIQQSLAGVAKQTFHEFYSWGNMLLNDFDELQQNRVNGEDVFLSLDEIKALKHWNLGESELTDFEKNYLLFYRSIAPCFTEFNKELLKNNKAYFGLAFDQLLASISTEHFTDYDSIIFAGFNALTGAEEELISFLNKNNKAEIYIDADDYYVNDKNQEAGRHIRKMISMFGNDLKWIGEHFKQLKNINISGIPANTAQVKYAGQLLKEMLTKGISPDEIAVVLVDENLLLPLLNSIPEEIEEFNVTMGLSLQQSSLFTFFSNLFNLFINAANVWQRNHPGLFVNENLPVFHANDVNAVLRYLADRFPNNATKEFAPPKKVYFSIDDLVPLFNNNAVTDKPVVAADISSVFGKGISRFAKKILNSLKEIALNEDDQSDKSGKNEIFVHYLYRFSLIIDQLVLLENEEALQYDLQLEFTVFKNLAASSLMPFYGEPLKGIQVMGMLETRLLDFENIIMVSVNEGLLPKGKQFNTFIPEDVRRAYGMPSYHDKNSVFAYHFYRLLQRAANVHLIYNTEGNNLGGGERSRFINQLTYEMPVYNPLISIAEKIIGFEPLLKTAEKISIKKNAAVMKQLQAMADRGISPSAMGSYMDCPLKFCLSYVFKIAEPDDVSETIDARAMGSLIHSVLQEIFSFSSEIQVQPAELKSRIKTIDTLLAQIAAKELPEMSFQTGKNKLTLEVSRKLIEQYIEVEASKIEGHELKILGLEEKIGKELEVFSRQTGEAFRVLISGYADRIDLYDGVLRILDYKTGYVDPKEVTIAEIEQINDLKSAAKIIQLLMYAVMLKGNPKFATNMSRIQSGIISLRMPSKYVIPAEAGGSNELSNDTLNLFESFLEEKLAEIFNEDIDFVQTDDAEKCKLCDFAGFCNRISL